MSRLPDNGVGVGLLAEGLSSPPRPYCQFKEDHMLIGYARTSTLEQVAGLEAQRAALKAMG